MCRGPDRARSAAFLLLVTLAVAVALGMAGCASAELPYDVPVAEAVSVEDVRELLRHPRENLARLRDLAERNSPDLLVLQALHRIAVEDENAYAALLRGVPDAIAGIGFRDGVANAGPGFFAGLIRPLVNLMTGNRDTDTELLARQYESKRLEVLHRLEQLVSDLCLAREREALEAKWATEAAADSVAVQFLCQKGLYDDPEREKHFVRERLEETVRRSFSARSAAAVSEHAIFGLIGAEPGEPGQP